MAGGLVGRLTALLYDRMCRRLEEVTLSEWRRDLLAPLSGEVLEIGAGTGLNIPWYPTTVTHLILTEPDPHMGVRLRSKIPLARADRITTLDAAVDALPIASGSIDAVVVTLVLCSVPDQHSALAEIYRVLRPGGRFVFLEHVADEDHPRRLKWQQRVEPIWKRLAGNCHLTRRTDQAITEAGFFVEQMIRAEFRPAPALVRASVRGVARKRGTPSGG